jgi:hypothetical protein
LPHEGRDPRPYYWGYCDECCADRKQASDDEDAEFNLPALIDAYLEYKRADLGMEKIA